jgi:small-conductance mechanosensitive channel
VLDEVRIERTPLPTPTPGRIAEAVYQVTMRAGLAWTEILGLTVADWINLGLSALYVLLAYLVGTWLVLGLLRSAVRRTPTELDDLLVAEVGSKIRWLIVVLVFYRATQRLIFLSVEAKWVLSIAYLIGGTIIAFRVVWQLIDLVTDWYRRRSRREGREDELSPIITLLNRLARLILALVTLSVVLSALGINVAALATLLGIGGLAISLAAQDTIADAIAGMIILADRPFRIGDRIEIPGAGTWGDVVDIGLRTTRIRTRDNRMVIVPNSIIGSSQVVNYTYPDPIYRIETHVHVAYGTPIETVRNVIAQAVRPVDHVLPDRPVDVLYLEMGDSAMVFRVRWWIESYVDTRRVEDAVHTAIQEALNAAGIVRPYPTSTVRLEAGDQATTDSSGILHTHPRDDKGVQLNDITERSEGQR